mmetsp:Transcript_21842/g.36474  ORF Transcript_21842/g.36474 Transcript_21842/m.36474 type:complete len:222 (-) Transcript_21842:156-821(-)
MSANSSRREAYTATIIACGFFGGSLTVASEILKYDASDLWDACKGKRPKSFGPYLAMGALIPFALSTFLGLMHSRKAVQVTFSGRLFCWGNRQRGFRLHLVASFLFGWVFFLFGLYLLIQHTRVDLENQRCKGSLAAMRDNYTDLEDGVYVGGGAASFLSTACSAIYFVINDRRKRRKLRVRRYNSSRYFSDGASGEDTGDELPHTNPVYSKRSSSGRRQR